MQYLKVRWKHSFSDEPTLIYSELDEGRWEQRKIEIFPGGEVGHADGHGFSGTTRLSKEPLPTESEIAEDSQFSPSVISAEEFEEAWKRRAKGGTG